MIISQGILNTKTLGTFPFILSPNFGGGAVIHSTQHLCHATEMAGPIHRVEQVDRTLPLAFPEGSVQPFVAVLCRTPDFVFDTPGRQ